MYTKVWAALKLDPQAYWENISLSPVQQRQMDQSRALPREAADQGLSMMAQAYVGDLRSTKGQRSKGTMTRSSTPVFSRGATPVVPGSSTSEVPLIHSRIHLPTLVGRRNFPQGQSKRYTAHLFR